MRARREFGISAELILCFPRDYSAEYAMATLLEALPYKDWIIGVDRIDHGTNIVEDERLVELAKAKGIGLTCCPVSNSFVTEQMKSAEIVALLDRGLAVTVNSDDPAYFDAYAADNYLALAAHAGLDLDRVVELAKNSFRASWTGGQVLREIDDYVAAHRTNGSEIA